MICKTILILFIIITCIHYLNIRSLRANEPTESKSPFKQLVTKEFIGKVGQTIVIDTFSQHNTRKRDRSILEKNIRNLVMGTGQTGKNIDMVSEIGETSVHYVIDHSTPITQPVIDKVTEYSKTKYDNTRDSLNSYLDSWKK